MRRAQRTVVVGLGAVAWWLVSCREIPAPEGGVASISALLLPSPGLVVNDTLRDSTGLVAPLRVIAYGIDGDTVAGAQSTFVALDSGAHLSGALLIGDKEGRTVQIVGTVASLQTRPTPVKVTLSPDLIIATDSTLHRKTFLLVSGDTIVTSADLATSVVHNGASATGVEAVIVRYAIVQSPPGNGNGPTLVLLNGSIASSRDTTDAAGRAARTARLRLAAVTNALADTAILRATASYRGATIGTVTFTLIFTAQ